MWGNGTNGGWGRCGIGFWSPVSKYTGSLQRFCLRKRSATEIPFRFHSLLLYTLTRQFSKKQKPTRHQLVTPFLPNFLLTVRKIGLSPHHPTPLRSHIFSYSFPSALDSILVSKNQTRPHFAKFSPN